MSHAIFWTTLSLFKYHENEKLWLDQFFTSLAAGYDESQYKKKKNITILVKHHGDSQMVFGVSQAIITSTFPSFMCMLLSPKAKPSKGADGEGPLQSFGKLCPYNLDNTAFTVEDMPGQICVVGWE